VLGIARDTTAFSAGVNLTYLVPFGGRQPVPNLGMWFMVCVIPAWVCYALVVTGADLSPTGLVYIFHRKDEIRDGLYRLQQPPFWSATQHTQLSIASMGAGFRLGYSVAISGYTLVMGAPGDSLLAPNCGAATVVDTEYKRVRFAQKEFRVSEGTDKRRVILTVEREGDLSRTLSVQYSTRDVTAFGTNKTWHENCLKNVTFPTRSASGCGDYQQTRGLVRCLVLFVESIYPGA
jgi:Calx-beta domain